MRAASLTRPADGSATTHLIAADAADGIFDFGTGDFTLIAAVEMTTPGAILSRCHPPGSADGPGFGLWVDRHGAIVFFTDDGTAARAVASEPTRVLDGSRHAIAAVRQDGALSLRLDGATLATHAPPDWPADGRALDVGGGAPFHIGYGRSARLGLGDTFFQGLVMNVSVWRRALSARHQAPAAFGRLSGDEEELCAFWPLDGDLGDRSAGAAGGTLAVSGDPAGLEMTEASNLVFAQGPNDYVFFQLYGPNYPQTTIYNFEVPAGVPYFGLSIMADQDTPAFPTDVALTLTDPTGAVYGAADVNTDTVFASTVGGSLWAFMALIPQAGTWTITVKTQGTAAFTLTAQTYPSLSGAFPYSSHEALEPLFGDPSAARATGTLAASGWGWIAAAVAVTVGVVVVAGAVIAAGASAPVVVGAILVVGLLEVAEAHAVSSYMGTTTSLMKAGRSTSGLTCITPTKYSILYWDQYLEANQYASPYSNLVVFPATSYMCRLSILYSWILASDWNLNCNSYQGRDVVPATINLALSGPTVVYVTASGHGTCNFIGGWFDDSGTGATQRILYVPDIQNLGIASGKIFHLWACNTGILDCSMATGSANPDGATGPGLGASLVQLGAVAFFGYKDYVYLTSDLDEAKKFIACDTIIDTTMLSGGTCDAAYQAAIALYEQTYNGYVAIGDMDYASEIKSNWDALVCPSTNAAYGSKTAVVPGAGD